MQLNGRYGVEGRGSLAVPFHILSLCVYLFIIAIVYRIFRVLHENFNYLHFGYMKFVIHLMRQQLIALQPAVRPLGLLPAAAPGPPQSLPPRSAGLIMPVAAILPQPRTLHQMMQCTRGVSQRYRVGAGLCRYSIYSSTNALLGITLICVYSTRNISLKQLRVFS